MSAKRGQIEQMIFADWSHRRFCFQKAAALEDHAQLVKIPLPHVHREIFAVPALKDINAYFAKMVLMRPFPFTFQNLHLTANCLLPNVQMKIAQFTKTGNTVVARIREKLLIR